MTGLIKNELIKTGKSGFIRAAMCFILAVSILIPVGCKILNTESEYLPENYDELIENEPSEAGKAYYQVLKDTEKFFYDNNIKGFSDWRYNEYYSTLQGILMTKTALNLAKQGCEKTDVENFFMYELLNSEFAYDEKTAEFSSSEDNYKSIFELNADEVDKKTAEIDKIFESCKSFILKAVIGDFYKNTLDDCNAQVDFAKEEVEKAEKELALNPANEQKKYDLDVANAQLESFEIRQWGAKYLYDSKAKYDSWQYNTVTDLLNCAADAVTDNVPVSLNQFKTGNERHMFKSYDEYIQRLSQRKQDVENSIAIAKYSIENNIPIPEEMDDSARLNFINDVNTVLYMVGVLMVAIAGTTVFNEYSTGSIRLLLIRPKSRSKILMSKLLTVIIYGILTAAVVILILGVLDNALHTGKDFGAPYLIMSGGKVKKIPILLFVIEKAVAKLFSGFAIVAGAFMISAVFSKGGIFAIAAGSGAMCITYFMELVCANINEQLHGLLKYTVLPYLDLSQYMSNNITDFSYNNYSMFDDVFGGAAARVQFDPKIGAIAVAVHIAIFLIIAFYGFKKKQIKN